MDENRIRFELLMMGAVRLLLTEKIDQWEVSDKMSEEEMKDLIQATKDFVVEMDNFIHDINQSVLSGMGKKD